MMQNLHPHGGENLKSLSPDNILNCIADYKYYFWELSNKPT
jgi:hypothetical protein